MTEKKSKNVITTGPPAAGIYSPNQQNLIRPITTEDVTQDYLRCVNCGYCRDVCRVYNITFSERDYAGGRNRVLKSLAKKEVLFNPLTIQDLVFKCMLCGACREVCPVGIDTLHVFRSFRVRAVNAGVIPEKLAKVRDSIIEFANPFMEEGTHRHDWCQGNACNEGYVAWEKGVELYRKIESGELKPKDVDPNLVAYFIGCTSAYRNNELSSATCRVLDAMGVNFIVIPEEKCCGSVLFRTGVDDVATKLMKYNIDLIRKVGIKEVIFSCAGCFSTFSNEYVEYTNNNLGFKLSHVTQFIPRFAKEHNFYFKYNLRPKEDPLIITFHDPCHLARYTNVYEEPRELISMIEGIRLVEMQYIKKMNHCCGAGGGVRALYGDIATNIADSRLDETVECWDQINEDRLLEAVETKAESLVSACVFCKNNLSNAASQFKPDLPVHDILQILENCKVVRIA
ncbi:MAG: (Fe-S)-binding protein [Candidatus Lokiarchaeota archaeon]|nr:(Fe-S)-binding protein [Candidatus Lokiarchaeota archaeon]